MRPILGNLSCCEAFFVQSEELALLCTDRFLMSEYLTLSGPGAVSLLSPESASVNSSSVIMSSFEPAFPAGFQLCSVVKEGYTRASFEYCCLYVSHDVRGFINIE